MCNFRLARVATVCALVLCKCTSDEPKSANDSAGYFLKETNSNLEFGRGEKGTNYFWLKKKMLREAQLRAKPNTVNITKSLF